MFKYSKDGISVLSVLDARRAKKSGLFPVKIQVIHNRKQKYYSTGKELSKEDWEILAESKSRRLIEIRASVENSFSIIKKPSGSPCGTWGLLFRCAQHEVGQVYGYNP